MGGVSSTLDPSRGRSGEPTLVIPEGYVSPTWPALYIPTFWNTIQQSGIFLYEAEKIWRFTLYWTLALLGGLFLLCSLLASLTLFLSLTALRQSPPKSQYLQSSRDDNPSPSPTLEKHRDKGNRTGGGRYRPRPPLWPILLIPLVSCIVAASIALIIGTVIGFALAAVYSAGAFSMSTWVPFLWALIVLIVLIISSYSTLTPTL